MALKDIVVIVDNAKACAARLDYAAALANQFDAHLTGMYVTAPPQVPNYILAQIPAEARQAHEDGVRELVAKGREVFEDRMRKAGLDSRAEWRHVRGDPTAAAALFARYSDLVIAGQPDPDDATYMTPVHIDELLLICGRPVLIVPYAYRHSGQVNMVERVLVGWNGSREAARAVADALPLMSASKDVAVLAVNPSDELGPEPGADITLHLTRHGLRAEASNIKSRDVDPADAILSRAADLSSNLLVLGAYGRSRFRELVLGGVTRDILRQMTLPVMMSH